MKVKIDISLYGKIKNRKDNGERYIDIAKELGISHSSLSSRIKHIESNLKENLEYLYNEGMLNGKGIMLFGYLRNKD